MAKLTSTCFLLPLCLGVLLASGCGLEPVDTRIQFGSTVGDTREKPVSIPEGKFVCPNMILLNNRQVNTEAMATGEVEDVFGPYVPCNTLLDGGSGTCPTCQQTYNTNGGEAEGNGVENSKSVSVMAQPAFVCPYEDCQKVISVGAFSLERETGKTATAGRNHCHHCKRHFTIIARDAVEVVGAHEEMICPSCKKAVDPTLAVCAESSCKLKGKLLNTNALEAPCWRCGGHKICPDCQGSGSGSSGIFGKTPSECWYCGDTGRCPDCDEYGFATYEDSLPVKFELFKRGQDGFEPKLRKERKKAWKHDPPYKAAEGGEE